MNACSTEQATSTDIRSGAVIVFDLRVGVLGEQPEPRGGVAPDAFEISLHGAHSLLLQVVDPPGALGLLGDQPGVLQQAQVPRHGRPADRHGRGDLLDRLVAVAEQSQDLAPVRVAQRLERITGRTLPRHRSATCFDALLETLGEPLERRAEVRY